MILKKNEKVEVKMINAYKDYGIWESEIISINPIKWDEKCSGLTLNGILLPKECKIVIIAPLRYDYNIAMDYIEKVHNGETILCIWNELGYQVLIGKRFLRYFDKNR